MRKILLISNPIFHYRIKVYNAFVSEFNRNGFEFHVLTNSIQEVDFEVKFVKHELKFNVFSYINKIKDIDPVVVINFLQLKDLILIPLTLYCKFNRIPMVYWNHGVDNQNPNSIKNLAYWFVHQISSGILLYTPNERVHIRKLNHKKTFIAYNTLSFENSRNNEEISKLKVKDKYNISESFVILYVSRILPYKKLDVLIKLIKNNKSIALVVVGAGANETQLTEFSSNENIYYLGEKYGDEVDEIYKMGDVFSTPGHIGLALNQAFYWGKPVIVLDEKHAPEIYYMKNGETGFIVKNEIELEEKINLLREDRNLLEEMSCAAKNVADTEMTIEMMFSGFIDVINYCLDTTKKNE